MALLGRNGSGKSTLVNTITNHPELKWEGTIIGIPKPLFLGFQKPVEIPEIITIKLMLHLDQQYGLKCATINEFIVEYDEVLTELAITRDMLEQPLNKNVSGGENKRLELLQMYIVKPKLLLLDEIDTGIDLDMLITIGKFIKQFIEKYKPTVIIVTHNLSFLQYFKVDKVVVLDKGIVIAERKKDLIEELSTKGFMGTFPMIITD